EQVHNFVRSRLASAEPVGARLIAPLLSGEQASPAAQAADNMSAVSFVAFLLEAGGPGALHQFLAAYDPERRDQAALAVYHRPLGALEESWLAWLKRQSKGRPA